MTRVAIIGAGISGLVVARSLIDRCEVTLFEKSRGVGGRVATRYAGDWEFDHGAQFFTARTADFKEFLAPLIPATAISSWNAEFVEIDAGVIAARRTWDEHYPHFVATPRMNALGKFLANGLDVRVGVEVAGLTRTRGAWCLAAADGSTLGKYDWVVSSAPAAQSAALLPRDSLLQEHARRAILSGCCALMLGFDEAPDIGWQAALVRRAPISWISVNSSKPGRRSKFSVVVHSTNDWANRHLDDEYDVIKANMLDSASAVLGIDAAAAAHKEIHRWRYANIDAQVTAPQVDAEKRVAACGDWFVRGRVEGAFTSALRLTRELDQLI